VGIEPLVNLWIPGVPHTKGSLTVVNSGRGGRAAHVQDTPESKRWRKLMVDRLRTDRLARCLNADGPLSMPTYAGPVKVYAIFFQRLDDVTKKRAEAGDLDKLLRNLLDALSRHKDQDLGAGIIGDDMQVVKIEAEKRTAMSTGRILGPGVFVDVRPFR
jgi:Holliday junction resolvase RusA-like endonuclease